MTDREPTPLSLEQRNALDVIRRSCKDGQISNTSLYQLLGNLKSDLKLKDKNDGEFRAVVPKGITKILDLKVHDILKWQPTIIGEHVFVLVYKKKQESQ